MKSGGKVKNPADEIILAKSALLLYNSKNFGSANGMFDLDTGSGYCRIGRLLLFGKFFPPRFLCGLYYRNVIGTVPLIAGVLLKNTFIREGIHFVGNAFVMHLSFHGKAGKEDESRVCI